MRVYCYDCHASTTKPWLHPCFMGMRDDCMRRLNEQLELDRESAESTKRYS